MNNAAWMVYNKKADFPALAEQLGVDPVVIRVMTNRGIAPEEMEGFLHPSMEILHDPHELKDADKAAGLIQNAVQQGKKVRVIGDYDVDGIFSTYILTAGLRRVGTEVSYDIPHRITDGYGMNRRLVEQAKEDGIDLIVTCDNGIKALDEVKLAKELGMDVVVTDHHELGFDIDEDGRTVFRLPVADAVVNPHQPDCHYPFPQICGAAVAWKLVTVLYEACGIDRGEAMAFLPFAAFATIGDIMPLRDENRSIVYYGLKQMPGIQNPGLLSLMERTGVVGRPVNPYDVGFILGPCFNASGRLDTALRGVELLLEQDAARASEMAEAMRNLNDQRKSMTEQGTEEAIARIEEEGRQEDDVLVVYVPALHESLAGIVAGRIKEKYYRPTFVLTDGNEGVKGSGRSIPGYSMAQKLHDVEDILDRYGGHPMAAGVSLQKDRIDAFRRILNEKSGLKEKDLVATLWIDVPMPTAYISKELILQLEALEPFGEGNEKPLFAEKDVAPTGVRYLGKEGQYLKFTLPGNGKDRLEAVYFGDGQQMVADLTKKYGQAEVDKLFEGRVSVVRLTFTYYPQINSFNGRETMQVRIEDYKL